MKVSETVSEGDGITHKYGHNEKGRNPSDVNIRKCYIFRVNSEWRDSKQLH